MQVRVRNGRIEVLRSFWDEKKKRSNQKIVGTMSADPNESGPTLTRELRSKLSEKEIREVRSKVYRILTDRVKADAEMIIEKAPSKLKLIAAAIRLGDQRDVTDRLSEVCDIYKGMDNISEALHDKGLTRGKLVDDRILDDLYLVPFEARNLLDINRDVMADQAPKRVIDGAGPAIRRIKDAITKIEQGDDNQAKGRLRASADSINEGLLALAGVLAAYELNRAALQSTLSSADKVLQDTVKKQEQVIKSLELKMKVAADEYEARIEELEYELEEMRSELKLS